MTALPEAKLSSAEVSTTIGIGRASTTLAGQPLGLTWLPRGEVGHLSLLLGTPSPSSSASTGQPVVSTVTPRGVLGQRSMPSQTPSPSLSAGQPSASTVAPRGVLGHLSLL